VQPGRGRRRRSRRRARGLPRAARAGLGRRLGREGAGFAREDPPPPRLIVAIPGDGTLEAALERGAGAPAEQPFRLLGRPDVPVDLTRPLLDVAAEVVGLAE